ncbi:hypothetical protein D8674_029471 [Pyrus ussuriensis x Pyrus communis]|uniref:Uncharacterized protein n=1 Tax=Pyrus ussuriensis x Pyrus communis TaxID=2448454 RepID=A0A5N5ICT2_9ROSA|nr:hypothetical protein D8674_029471 [Pyrus ussuriensis x Pyrus communis]
MSNDGGVPAAFLCSVRRDKVERECEREMRGLVVWWGGRSLVLGFSVNTEKGAMTRVERERDSEGDRELRQMNENERV